MSKVKVTEDETDETQWLRFDPTYGMSYAILRRKIQLIDIPTTLSWSIQIYNLLNFGNTFLFLTYIC